MASDVDIINSALNMIGATNITSRTEDSKAARVTNQRYDFVRDAVFRAHPWHCLVKRQELAADTTDPIMEFDNAYQLPADCLRVLRDQYHDTVFRVEGRRIVTDESSIKIIYIARITDPNEYDALLMECISARLAADCAFALTASRTLAADMFALYEAKLSEARFINAGEGTPGALDNVTEPGSLIADTFINARF
jgi:hypothetical protein